jgi:uncharacterized protein YjbI with pentapeptide repeats
LFRDIITLPTQKRKAYGATNLGCANLSHANLSGANLSHANFSGTNLNHSNVSGSYIYTIVGTKLIRANLIHADVNNARLGFSSRILKSVKKDLIEPRTIIEYSSDDRSEFKNLVPC